MSTEILTYRIADAPTEPAPIPLEDLISGEPEAAITFLWKSDDGRLFNGVWHCTPGEFWLSHSVETICLVEGRATITPEDGPPVTVGAGDLMFLPGTVRARWCVHETVKKCFHGYDPAPLD